MKKRQRKIRLIRAGIQLLFFIFAPALFSTAFAGVKSVFQAIAAHQVRFSGNRSTSSNQLEFLSGCDCRAAGGNLPVRTAFLRICLRIWFPWGCIVRADCVYPPEGFS